MARSLKATGAATSVAITSLGALGRADFKTAHRQLSSRFVSEADEGEPIARDAAEHCLKTRFNLRIPDPTLVPQRFVALEREAGGFPPAPVGDRHGMTHTMPARTRGVGPELALGTGEFEVITSELNGELSATQVD